MDSLTQENRKKTLSRKGFKLKTKTREQTQMLRYFFKSTSSEKWSKQAITELASKVGLSYKVTNKWLWDQKNR